MNNAENYNQRLENLTKEVDHITDTHNKKNNINDFIVKNTKYLIIGGIPLFLTIVLIMMRFSFITKEDKENSEKKKLDFGKIIVCFIVLVFLTILGTYIYNYKK
jgi:heme/copper-type cytochrome/quinol oxidase subunit 2